MSSNGIIACIRSGSSFAGEASDDDLQTISSVSSIHEPKEGHASVVGSDSSLSDESSSPEEGGGIDPPEIAPLLIVANPVEGDDDPDTDGEHQPNRTHLFPGVQRLLVTSDGVWAQTMLGIVSTIAVLAIAIVVIQSSPSHTTPPPHPAPASPMIPSDNGSSTRSPVITTIRSDQFSLLCADLALNSNQTNQLIQWKCHSHENQMFIFEPVQETRYRIKVLATSYCVQIKDGAEFGDAWVVQGECKDELHQLWTVSGSGGYQRLQVAHTDMCLTIQGSSKDEGANLVQWPCMIGKPWTTDFWRTDDRLSTQQQNP